MNPLEPQFFVLTWYSSDFLSLNIAGVSTQTNKILWLGRLELLNIGPSVKCLGLVSLPLPSKRGPSFRGELLETIKNTYLSILTITRTDPTHLTWLVPKTAIQCKSQFGCLFLVGLGAEEQNAPVDFVRKS